MQQCTPIDKSCSSTSDKALAPFFFLAWINKILGLFCSQGKMMVFFLSSFIFSKVIHKWWGTQTREDRRSSFPGGWIFLLMSSSGYSSIIPSLTGNMVSERGLPFQHFLCSASRNRPPVWGVEEVGPHSKTIIEHPKTVCCRNWSSFWCIGNFIGNRSRRVNVD